MDRVTILLVFLLLLAIGLIVLGVFGLWKEWLPL
jgi:hypothetical protein